jgi:hypothetical protein
VELSETKEALEAAAKEESMDAVKRAAAAAAAAAGVGRAMVPKSRGQVHYEHEHEVLFSTEARPGLRDGDIVALVTQDAAAHPYCILREANPEAFEDESFEDRHVYRLGIDASIPAHDVAVLQASHPATHLEMVKSSSGGGGGGGGGGGAFWSFRAPMAGGLHKLNPVDPSAQPYNVQEPRVEKER